MFPTVLPSFSFFSFFASVVFPWCLGLSRGFPGLRISARMVSMFRTYRSWACEFWSVESLAKHASGDRLPNDSLTSETSPRVKLLAQCAPTSGAKIFQEVCECTFLVFGLTRLGMVPNVPAARKYCPCQVFTVQGAIGFHESSFPNVMKRSHQKVFVRQQRVLRWHQVPLVKEICKSAVMAWPNARRNNSALNPRSSECSQTVTSSLLLPNVSIAQVSCSSVFSLEKQTVDSASFLLRHREA